MAPPSPARLRSGSISAAQFDELKKLIEESRVSVIETIRGDLKVMENKLSARVEAIEASLDSIRNDCDDLSAEIEIVKQTIQDNEKGNFDACMEELQGRMARMNSLIFRGVPELDTGSIEERVEYDMSRIQKVLSDLNVASTDVLVIVEELVKLVSVIQDS